MNLDNIPKHYESNQIEHLNKKSTYGWVYMDNTKVYFLIEIAKKRMYPILYHFCVSYC